MSERLPIVTAKEIIKVAQKVGFLFDRQKGSHAIYYRKIDKARIVVPVHPSKEIKIKTMLGIISEMGIDVDEFKRILKD